MIVVNFPSTICHFPHTEYWNDSTLSTRNRAHLMLAESGFFYRKAEMLNRMPELKHKINTKKNLVNAVLRAENIQTLPGAKALKEYTLAEEFMNAIKQCPMYQHETNNADWPTQSRLLPELTSSDATLSSDNNAKSDADLTSSLSGSGDAQNSTVVTPTGEEKVLSEREEKKRRNRRKLIESLQRGEVSEPELM